METHPLDRWLPQFQFTETHALVIQADAHACLDAAEALDPADDRLIGFMLALREAPGRLADVLGLPGGLRQRPRFGLADFLPLGRDGDRSLAYGLTGQFWRTSYGLHPQTSPEAYLAYAEAGAARLALSFHTEPAGAGHTRLVTTTRVHCFDAEGHRRFTPYWWLIRPVSGLIRRRLLGSIRRVAES